ncbi:hypothetical protein A4A49_51340 [Nicotiana attenuata]|uniref:DUF223 domain-containing protein n=1 Tax=Nicotiana attenuata TaxID=49451 RepID=A0A314KIG9_NICAT|nr:hypothetical protein A4A49_51340 [Nicotiana attenuata]
MFQIDLIDGSGSTTAIISDDVAEKNLLMTPEDIFDTTCVKEQQIRGVMWGDEIQYYADKLKLFHTYLISTARVKVLSTQYGRPIHKFYWMLDKETIVELVEQNSEREIPLPPPRKSNLADFNHIAHMTLDPATEIGRGPNRCCEIIVTDNQKTRLLLTLWEDFSEVEGTIIQQKIESKVNDDERYPVILGRSIGISLHKENKLHKYFIQVYHCKPDSTQQYNQMCYWSYVTIKISPNI